MNNFENFDISKALELSHIYDKKRHYAKEKLLSDLIRWQHFFGDTSIVGVKISLEHRYQKTTVKTVLNELGYKLTSYRTITIHPYCCGTSENFIEITFTPKDSDSTEG